MIPGHKWRSDQGYLTGTPGIAFSIIYQCALDAEFVPNTALADGVQGGL
jgi:hypothetical protein